MADTNSQATTVNEVKKAVKSRFKPHVEFANFVCKFGERINLADMLEQAVFPAFLATGLTRSYGDTTYLIVNPELSEVAIDGEKQLAVSGNFVKDTVLERMLRLENGVLVDDLVQLPSAETSFFVLLLESHRMVYLRRTANSPGLEAFRATLERFLREKYEDYIGFLQAELAKDINAPLREALAKDLPPTEEGRREDKGLQRLTIPKTTLRRAIPRPELQVIALGSTESLDKYLDLFAKINYVRIEFAETNDEPFDEGFLNDIQKSRKNLGASKTALVSTDPVTMKKDGVRDQLQAAAKTSNAETEVRGFRENGQEIKGDQNNFALRIPQEDVTSDPKQLRENLVTTFTGAVNSGILSKPSVSDGTVSKVRSFLAHIKEINERYRSEA